MPAQKKESKGTANIVAGSGVAAYGAANAPVLRSGYKDMSRMTNASPKKQAGRYQAELHQAMQSGKVPSDSSVHVLRTPSGRHINAGGTHRQIAREAMGKPSNYRVKDISHEIHVSPAQKLESKVKMAQLKRGSRRAERGKPMKPVSSVARGENRSLAARADIGDAHLWSHPSAIREPVKLGRKMGMANAGMIAGTGALAAGVGALERHQWKKKHGQVAKARSMSDAEIRHRKKIQGAVSRTTSTLGLTGLGITGAAALAAKRPGALKAVRRVPGLKGATPERMRNAAINTGIVSGGISGVGGFNFASYTGAEAKKKRPAMPVTKREVPTGLTDDFGFYGEIGKASEWKPSASKFDAERGRLKRSQAYEDAGAVATGGLAAGAGIQGAKAGRLVRANTRVSQRARNLPNVGAKVAERGAKAAKHGKAGAALAGATLAVGGATAAVHNRNRSRSWAAYGKRSAFGIAHEVSHDPSMSGQHRETESRG